MTTLSTHVLDAGRGVPAEGLDVRLAGHLVAGDGTLATSRTDADGRVRFDVELQSGPHLLTFETGAWFDAQGRDTFFSLVNVAFEVDAEEEHHHVALLLSPYSYTTYKGS
ncbi:MULTISPECIES: hydroxyisourate hydrolase [unclassified Nocardioides]|uniref:hydroxyisourate hydrolase n=1 Tax=unclassified Nocardioides TaxID=2615069 RepID=UPI000056FDB7|nr:MULTISPECIES: hydroxyisourate hydrolase [unclassified Nocardioides]ABL80659.1 Transthyretin [Nocardioides sp. JS614]